MTLATRLRFIPMLLLAACASREQQSARVDSAPAPSTPTVPAVRRDTSRMVVYDLPAAAYDRAPRFSLSATPVTTVRGQNFTGDLGTVFRPLLMHDGRLVFFLDGSVVVVGSDGKEGERIGRSGAGPGEFKDGLVIRGLGDTILLHDRGNGRISFVVPGSGVVRMRALSPSTLQRLTGVVGQYADDALLIASEGFGLAAEPNRPTVTPWLSGRLAAGSETIDILDSVAGPKIVWHNGGPAPLRLGNLPVTVAWGEELLVSDGTRWALERISADGVVQARYLLPIPRRPVSAAQIALDTKVQLAEMRERWRRNPSKADTTRLIASVRNAPTVDSLPLIAKALVGPDSIAWIKDGGYMFAEPTWAWTAVKKDGTILGRLIGKGKDPVVAFGAGSVMLKSEDDDGFVTFRVHRLSLSK